MNQAPWLSVITVVKDDNAGLLTTLASLKSQNLDGVEHVVVDSSAISEEPTVAAFNLLSINRIFSWIEPSGIYPAMNRGLELANGTFVYFLNAGDTFLHESILERVHRSLTESNPQWAFGPVVIQEPHGATTLTPPWNYQREKVSGFSNGNFPAHQGIFAHRALLSSFGGFDVQYKIAADYAAFLRLSQVADPLILDFPIATFQEGGTSTTHWKLSLREFHQARCSILQLAGPASLRERFNSFRNFCKMWLVREVLRRNQYN